MIALKVIEAEYKGQPTFLIGIEVGGVVVRAVKWVDPVDDSSGPPTVTFVDRAEYAWHTLCKSDAYEALDEILKMAGT